LSTTGSGDRRKPKPAAGGIRKGSNKPGQEGYHARHVFIAVVAAAMLIDLRASEAYYGNGPWCAVESAAFSTVTEDCSMRSLEQCRM
jgi:hypothetical protein